ncbi:hypothetical protein CR105_14530 [Massilia eurypsychrophila]|uniref:HTH cro/C1-type domain-containing protein n=1 Tax=Massilia eurypsychrophila TaxID=1485217 RepID=A0A2G8TE66_9BURK|nr:helix-turn-helix domain-containing protein [Massilia eurypsychrophila]PIL44284.1 hypothetical protein CR105_14530 [Massilia eurypsychrophila]
MDKRRKPIDKDMARDQRATLYAEIDRGEVSLQHAVKRMRKISGLTQSEFAKHRGVSAKVIKEIEQGIGNPTIESLNQIGNFFGLEVAFVQSANLNRERGATRQTKSGVFFNTDNNPRFISTNTVRDRHLRSGSSEGMNWNVTSSHTRPYSAVSEVREIIDAVEKMKMLASPTKSVADAMRHSNSVDGLSKLKGELEAIDSAKRIIETAEEIERKIQPPRELKKWLENIEHIRKMLEPFHEFETGKKTR